MYALLSYCNSINLGDEIQSIATERLLELHGVNIGYYYDRDTATLTTRGSHREHGAVVAGASADAVGCNQLSCPITIVYNGWFDGAYTRWPDTAHYRVVTVSTHINENEKDVSYAWLHPESTVSLVDPVHSEFYSGRTFGCRDIHTYARVMRALPAMSLTAPADVYISGCISATLGVDARGRSTHSARKFDINMAASGNIYIVDIAPENITGKVPAAITDIAKYVSHVYGGDLSLPGARDVKFAMARQLLMLYRDAALVITSRLHCAMPCLAYGTPVLFYHETYPGNDVRYIGNIDTVPVIGRDTIDYGNVVNVLPPEWESRVYGICNTIADVVKNNAARD